MLKKVFVVGAAGLLVAAVLTRTNPPSALGWGTAWTASVPRAD